MSEGKFKRINSIEIAEKTLERTIGFVNSCDTKASIVLALVGILLTVISTELPTYIVSTKGKDNFQNSVIFMLFIACTVLSFLFIAIATAFLISVLFGRLNSSGNSNIYFGNIKSYNLDDYKKRIKYLTDCNYERDLIEQIYINARICSKKYRKFNISLVFLAIGMVFFIGAIFIEILRKGDNLREIGIRGDCVYAIYTTPKKYDVYEIAVKTFWINTYVNMLNKLLDDRDFPQICIGIGASAAQELVVKAGRKNTGINSKVWIGNAVTTASHLSSEGSKNGNASILFSECFYSNCIDELVNVDGEEVRRLFTRKYTSKLGNYYSANVVMSEYDEWINEGMMD